MIYKSVGKFKSSVIISVLSFCKFKAANKSLYKFNEVVSPTKISSGCAPTILAILVAISLERSIQCSFQLLISLFPHWFSTILAEVSIVLTGNFPNELPSR